MTILKHDRELRQNETGDWEHQLPGKWEFRFGEPIAILPTTEYAQKELDYEGNLYLDKYELQVFIKGSLDNDDIKSATAMLAACPPIIIHERASDWQQHQKIDSLMVVFETTCAAQRAGISSQISYGVDTLRAEKSKFPTDSDDFKLLEQVYNANPDMS